MNSKRGKWYLVGVGCLVLAWTLGSWAIWSDIAAKPGAFAIPIAVLSWPGHEICLAISGHGMGANARCPATVWSFLVFSVQALVTWALLVPCVLAIRRRWVWAVSQGLLLVLLFAGFWKWGNG